MKKKETKKTKWFVLEWCGMDNDIDLYEWESAKNDEAEVWEEVRESAHNWESFLVMDKERLNNLLRAVESLQKTTKGRCARNGRNIFTNK